MKTNRCAARCSHCEGVNRREFVSVASASLATVPMLGSWLSGQLAMADKIAQKGPASRCVPVIKVCFVRRKGEYGMRCKRLGFGRVGIFFFVVMLSHIQVRGQVAGSGLVYIEYFYLVMYVTLLLTALNVYLFSLESGRRDGILQARDNLYIKLLYWPALLWVMALISWLVL